MQCNIRYLICRQINYCYIVGLCNCQASTSRETITTILDYKVTNSVRLGSCKGSESIPLVSILNKMKKGKIFKYVTIKQ